MFWMYSSLNCLLASSSSTGGLMVDIAPVIDWNITHNTADVKLWHSFDICDINSEGPTGAALATASEFTGSCQGICPTYAVIGWLTKHGLMLCCDWFSRKTIPQSFAIAKNRSISPNVSASSACRRIGLCSWEHLNDRWSWRHATIWSRSWDHDRDVRVPVFIRPLPLSICY